MKTFTVFAAILALSFTGSSAIVDQCGFFEFNCHRNPLIMSRSIPSVDEIFTFIKDFVANGQATAEEIAHAAQKVMDAIDHHIDELDFDPKDVTALLDSALAKIHIDDDKMAIALNLWNTLAEEAQHVKVAGKTVLAAIRKTASTIKQNVTDSVVAYLDKKLRDIMWGRGNRQVSNRGWHLDAGAGYSKHGGANVKVGLKYDWKRALEQLSNRGWHLDGSAGYSKHGGANVKVGLKYDWKRALEQLSNRGWHLDGSAGYNKHDGANVKVGLKYDWKRAMQ